MHRLTQLELKWKSAARASPAADSPASTSHKVSPTLLHTGLKLDPKVNPIWKDHKYDRVTNTPPTVSPEPLSPSRGSIDGQIERALARKKAREAREGNLAEQQKDDFAAGLAERKKREDKMKNKLSAGRQSGQY